jgi:hypothetical protein
MSDNEANPLQDLDFQFTVTGGQVTAMQAVLGSQSFDRPLLNNATFTVGTDTVTETLTNLDSTKVVTYTQDAGSSTLYDKSDVTLTFTHPSTADGGFAFTVNNNVVTAEQHVETANGHSQSENVHISLDAVTTLGTGVITEQWVKGDEVDTVTFTQPTGSTLYAVSSIEKTFIDEGAATTALDVNPKHRLEFTIDSSGNVTQAEHLTPQGNLYAVTNPNVSFTQLAPGYVEKLITNGSETSYAVFYQGQGGNGIYTEIAHGSGSTVDLAGLQSQVTEAEHLLKSVPSSSTGWVI